MATYLIIGFLLLGAIALVTLVLALAHAEDGWEDESGFHRIAPAKAAGPNPPPWGPATRWDNIEGVSCTIDDANAARLWNWGLRQSVHSDQLPARELENASVSCFEI